MSLFGDFGVGFLGGEGQAASYGTVAPLALVSRATSASFTSTSPVTYTLETFDSESVIAVTASAMTVPTAGFYRFGAGASTSVGTGFTAQKAQIGGAAVYGGFGSTVEPSSPRWHSGWGAPLSLSASALARLINEFQTASYGVDAANYTWFCLERLPAAFNYARVRKSSNQTSFTSGNVSFDTEDADTVGWHDTVTNNERLTVQSGISRVRVSGNIVTGNFNGAVELEITKNGSSGVVGLPAARQTGNGNKLVNLFSPPINVAIGDYFALNAVFASSSSIIAEEYTWFAIEEVPSAIRSALVYNSSGHSLGTTDAVLNWDSEDHDPDGMHSTSSDTSRLTVPSGCSWARLHFHIKGQLNSTAIIWAQMLKNGAAFVGTGIDSRVGASGTHQKLRGVSAWIAVTPGDYFELEARVNTGSITTTGGWFAMECM